MFFASINIFFLLSANIFYQDDNNSSFDKCLISNVYCDNDLRYVRVYFSYFFPYYSLRKRRVYGNRL